MDNKTSFFGKYIWIISFVALIGILMGTGYSYFKQALDVGGNAQIVQKIDTEDRVCSVIMEKSYTETSDGTKTTYNYSFTMTNQTDEPMFFWTVYFAIPDDAEVSASGSEAEIVNNTLYLHSMTYNNYVDAGESVTFNASITTSYEYTVDTIHVEDCELIEHKDENDDLSVDITRNQGWGTYIYPYDVTITNNGTSDIKAWEIYMEVPENISILAMWNANYVLKGTTLIISNAGHNGGITVGNSTSFGMQMQVSTENYVPTVTKVLGR